MMKPGEWVIDVLGKPWIPGGRGPDEFDCYGLLWWVQKKYFGQTLPDFAGVNPASMGGLKDQFEAGLDDWQSIPEPVEGCGVAMSRKWGFIHHCGIYTSADRGLVAHAPIDGRVHAQTLRDLRVRGWKRIEYFVHKPKP